MLNAHMVQVIQNLIGWALDQEHDMHDYPGHLEDLCESDVSELETIARELANIVPAEYLQAARHLLENIHDELPREIQSTPDAREFELVLSSHLYSLSGARQSMPNVWLVPAPYDGTAELAPLVDVPFMDYGLRDSDIPLELQRLRDTSESSDASAELARVMLAAGALYARGFGLGSERLSQCLKQAMVWERG